MRRPFWCWVLLLSVTAPCAWSRETESVGRGEFPNQENYRNFPGIMRLINHQSRVYQRWRDGYEDFYYLSDAATVNAALLRFAVIEAEEHLIVLAPGPNDVQTLSKKSIEANWSLHLVGGTARKDAIENGQKAPSPVLTIYVGDDIELDTLKIPNSLNVLTEEELKQREAEAARAKKIASRPTPGSKSVPATKSAPASKPVPATSKSTSVRAPSKPPAQVEKPKPKSIEQAKSESVIPEDVASEERRKQRIAIQEYVNARRKK